MALYQEKTVKMTASEVMTVIPILVKELVYHRTYVGEKAESTLCLENVIKKLEESNEENYKEQA